MIHLRNTIYIQYINTKYGFIYSIEIEGVFNYKGVSCLKVNDCY